MATALLDGAGSVSVGANTCTSLTLGPAGAGQIVITTAGSTGASVAKTVFGSGIDGFGIITTNAGTAVLTLGVNAADLVGGAWALPTGMNTSLLTTPITFALTVGTLARDVYFNSLNFISPNITINTANFRVFVKGVLTLNTGVVFQNNGGAGGNAAAGVAGAAGAADTALATLSLKVGGLIGAAGANAGAAGGASVASLGGSGGAGALIAANAGGAAGAVTVLTATQGDLHLLYDPTTAIHMTTTGTTPTIIRGGGSGGSGASAAGLGSGGSGSGGGIVMVAASQIANVPVPATVVFRALGGAAGTSEVGAGNSGGGGGGVAVVVTSAANVAVTLTNLSAAGGAVGTGGTVGASTAGAAGKTYLVTL